MSAYLRMLCQLGRQLQPPWSSIASYRSPLDHPFASLYRSKLGLTILACLRWNYWQRKCWNGNEYGAWTPNSLKPWQPNQRIERTTPPKGQRSEKRSVNKNGCHSKRQSWSSEGSKKRNATWRSRRNPLLRTRRQGRDKVLLQAISLGVRLPPQKRPRKQW